jgi:dihydroflavonol-4-reductase
MQDHKTTAFVTGGTGLLGSRLIYDLINSGRKVVALKRKNSDKKLINRYLENNENLFWVEGDITDIFTYEQAMQQADEVYHTAAEVNFSTLNKDHIYKINVEGTANMVNAALELKVKKFCHVSSVATLGKPYPGSELNENDWKEINKKSVYAITKFQAEREVWRGIAEGLNAVIVNPVVILGPGDWRIDSSKIIALMAGGLKFFTSGNISLVDVKDVSSIMIKLMDRNIFGERFIISQGTYTYIDFFKEVTACLGIEAPDFELKKWMLEIAWRADAIKAFITRTPGILSQEISEALFRNYKVSNKKIKEKLEYEFISLPEMVDDICHLYLKEEV